MFAALYLINVFVFFDPNQPGANHRDNQQHDYNRDIQISMLHTISI